MLMAPFDRMRGTPKKFKWSLNDWFLPAKGLHDSMDFYDKCRGIARNDLDPRKKEIWDLLQALYEAGWSEEI